jgi:hypothetical protein
MPRSGSSLLAGILHRLGIPMGSDADLQKGQHLNKHGCYEDQWFQSISLNILFESRLLLDISRRLEMDEEQVKAVVAKYRPKIEKYVTSRDQKVWGFKDPGLIYHLPHYHEYFENPYYIHLIRNTKDTAGSLYKTFRPAYWWPEFKDKFALFSPRNRFMTIFRSISLFLSRQQDYNQRESFERVIEHGHARIRNFLRDKKHITVHLEDLLGDPRSQVAKVQKFVGLESERDKLGNALAFIDPNLVNSY